MSPPSAPAGPSAAIVAAICGAEILGLAGYSIVPALLPQFIDAWSLTNTQAGWLVGIVSAGYMLSVVPLVGLTDRRPARQIYLASSVLSTLSCFGLVLCDGLLPAIGFPAVAGIALAGMYMPGLQALTHGVEGTMRARIAGFYTSSFTIGASLSFLLGGVGTLLGWRSAFVLAGTLVPPVSSSHGPHSRRGIPGPTTHRNQCPRSDKTLNCPGHYSRFDCEKGGHQICGHATQNLPQFRLRVAGNGDIFAEGVDELIYGRLSNTLTA